MEPGTYSTALDLTIDLVHLAASTTFRPTGANVLTITTAVTSRQHPCSLVSTFVSAPGCPTRALFLRQGLNAEPPAIHDMAYQDGRPATAAMVIHRPELCVIEHANHLIAWFDENSVTLRINIPESTVQQFKTI
jgi:hypothetical protein